MPSTRESLQSFVLSYTSPVHYRFLSCWKKRLHKPDQNLEGSETRQVPAGRGRTRKLQEVGDKVFLRSKGVLVLCCLMRPVLRVLLTDGPYPTPAPVV